MPKMEIKICITIDKFIFVAESPTPFYKLFFILIIILCELSFSQDEQPSKVFISRHWLSLYYHCSTPGPIFSNDFACPHGGRETSMLCVNATTYHALLCAAILPYPTHRRPQEWCQALPESIGNKLFER